jgi:hypothetical protein
MCIFILEWYKRSNYLLTRNFPPTSQVNPVRSGITDNLVIISRAFPDIVNIQLLYRNFPDNYLNIGG